MRFPSQFAARLATGAAALTAAAGGVAALPSIALADAAGGPSAGHVYLDDNTAGANTIAGFTRDRSGALTPLAGSPFAAGGAGSGQGIPSQGAVEFAGHGRFLIAVDAGSNQVSVLNIERGGALAPVAGGPVSSGGVDPVSIAVSRGRVVVANAGATAPNLSEFRLLGNGRLVPLATVALPAGSQPGDVLFNRSGTRLVATLVASSQIASFTVDGDGSLISAPGSPYAAQGLGPFGSEFSPINPDQLFVSNAHNGAGLGTVSAFDDLADGSLSSIGSSPVADGQTAPCWVTISPDGGYLYAVNTGSGTISSYTIAADGALTVDASTTVSAQAGVGAVDPGLTPDGTVLYINESRAGAVGEFAVDGGALTELPGSPVALPAGSHPAGIAVR
jgi:6-phosphogluconolactonase (cycloisomerase 2 family)